MADRTLLTITELEKKFRVHRTTIYRWLKSKKLRGIRMGGRWRFDPDDLDKFLKYNNGFNEVGDD